MTADAGPAAQKPAKVDYSRLPPAKRTPLTMAAWVMLYIAMIPFVNWGFNYIHDVTIVGDFKFNPLTVVAGLVLVVRDFTQRQIGGYIFLAMIVALAGTVATAGIALAFASGTAFFISETVDWALFTFTRTTLAQRILLSTAIAAPIDSLAFLFLADTAHVGGEGHQLLTGPNLVMSILAKLLGLAVVLLLMRMRERKALAAANAS